ncbi:MAG: hypothetical protein ACKN9I_00550, partial [Alphaproteobacteria bacterium]
KFTSFINKTLKKLSNPGSHPTLSPFKKAGQSKPPKSFFKWRNICGGDGVRFAHLQFFSFCKFTSFINKTLKKLSNPGSHPTLSPFKKAGFCQPF